MHEQSIRFLHAADLHLDAPLKGLSTQDDHGLARFAGDAAFLAFERILRLAEAVRPDFLLLAGDLANAEHRSVRARRRLAEGVARMTACGIRVLLVRGNHDPLGAGGVGGGSDRIVPGAAIFPETPARILLRLENGASCVVRGVSFARAHEDADLAARLVAHPGPVRLLTLQGETGAEEKDIPDDALEVALLHCSVTGAGSQDVYAPCQIAELTESGLDCWSLGHVHKPSILSEHPLVAYPGSPQGLDVSEDGAHGCLLVHAHSDPLGGWQLSRNFIELAPARWMTLRVDVSGVESVEEIPDVVCGAVANTLNDIMESRSEAGCAAAGGAQGRMRGVPAFPLRLLLVRVVLVGNTMVDGDLRREMEEHGKAIAEAISGMHPGDLESDDADVAAAPAVRMKDLRVETFFRDEAQLLGRDDLVGVTLSCIGRMEADGTIFREVAGDDVKALFRHRQLGEILKESFPRLFAMAFSESGAAAGAEETTKRRGSHDGDGFSHEECGSGGGDVEGSDALALERAVFARARSLILEHLLEEAAAGAQGGGERRA